MDNNNNELSHPDHGQVEAHILAESDKPNERHLAQFKGQLSRKKSFKDIIILILMLALIIFAIVPFLATAIVFLLYGLSH